MSEERAARFNSGKVPMQYLPLSLVVESFGELALVTDEEFMAFELLELLASYQKSGDIEYVKEAISKLALANKWGECAYALEFGAKKYSAWNWTKGSDWTIPLSSATRHIFKILLEKESNDSESGCTHIGHVMCNLVFLRIFMESYPAGNDLPPKNFNIPKSADSVPTPYETIYRLGTSALKIAQEADNIPVEDSILDLLDYVWYKLTPDAIKRIENNK